MSQEKKGKETGEALARKLESLTTQNEELIAKWCAEAMKACYNEQGKFIGRIRTAIRKTIQQAFPEKIFTEAEENNCPLNYYKTSSGQGKKLRYEHLALFYLSEDWQERLTMIGDEAKENHFAKSPTSVEDNQSIPEQRSKLEMLTIDDLGVEEAIQGDISFVLETKGISLAEFIQEACEIQAKTLKEQLSRRAETLAHVPTEELLTKKFSTHPQRPYELTKRAIQAIKHYNASQPDPKDRWIITANLITTLTGVRQTTARDIINEFYKDEVESHNQKYPEFYKEDGSINTYWNRKEGQDPKTLINVAELVPNGLD